MEELDGVRISFVLEALADSFACEGGGVYGCRLPSNWPYPTVAKFTCGSSPNTSIRRYSRSHEGSGLLSRVAGVTFHTTPHTELTVFGKGPRQRTIYPWVLRGGAVREEFLRLWTSLRAGGFISSHFSDTVP